MDVRGKLALVVGLGESGLAMAKWLVRQGAEVRVADSRPLPPNSDLLHAELPGVTLFCGPFAAPAFARVELIAISPGVPVQETAIQEAVARGVPLVSEIELFAWNIRRSLPQPQIIAITGSNGKTTTTALTGALCRAAGRQVAVAGNIGPAVLDALMAALDDGVLPELWVLELSSFQLETTHTLNADAAALVNVSEDHLDRYAGMEDYAASKMRVFQGGGVMVLNRDDRRSLAARCAARRAITFGLQPAPGADDYGLDEGWIVRGAEKLIRLSDLRLVGRHNAANAMAALALCAAVGIDERSVLPALAAFGGLPHRVEKVSEINGVDYYDDSKGTNVGATQAAIEGLGRPVVIILGGDGKGQDFAPLRRAVEQHARAVALIGRDARLIAAVLDGCRVPLRQCGDMTEAVRWCSAQAQRGDAVLLSPACASLDMYRNYAHRAEEFVAAVHSVAGEVA
jgi:UDP-N-acetylmuramoylalanine--D-glutamate ligase